MNQIHPPFRTPGLLFSLALLRTPARSRALSQLLKLDENSVREELSALEKAGLVHHDREHCLWLAAGEKKRQELGRLAAHFMPGKELESPTTGLALLWNGRLVEGATLLGEDMRRLIMDAHSSGAVALLDIFLQSLEKWDESTHSPEENEGFARVTKKILGVVLYLAKRRRQANLVFAVLVKAAESYGDRRTVLQVRMMQVCLHYLVGGVLEDDPNAALEGIINQVRELGDEDILTGAAHGIGIQHYIHGEFAEAIENFRRFNFSDPEENLFYSGIASICVATSACHLGRFGNAIGTVLMALRTYGDAKAQFAFKRTRLLGADVLLRAGYADAALAMMDEAWTCCDAESESRLTVWALRNLAFYHFQKRNMRYAHKLLATCVRMAEDYDIHWPFRWFPEFFEMLWAFEELGYAPLRGYDLNSLTHRILNGPSVQSQGIALRIKARGLSKKRRFKAALKLLEASLSRLEHFRNPMEQARTRLDMAASLDGLGKKAEAAALRTESRSALIRYHQYDRDWLHECEAPLPPVPQADGTGCASAWRERFTAFSDWSSFKNHLQWMVDCLRDAMEVERVALYTVENDHVLENLAARDFTPKEYAEKLPFLYGKRLLDCAKSGRPVRWRSRYGACLALPLRISEERNGVLLAHCTYLIDSIMERDLAFFEPIRLMLEEEVRLSYRVRDGVNALQLKETTRSRLAAERVVNAEGIYYGPAMHDTIERADKAAPTPAPVLILGETGAGKEELSRRVHRNSGRPGPFIVVNPMSIPEQLFESELFGHEKGAFTGAYQQKLGVLELADRGTLFIDEIGEIPLAMQAKFLRVLQDKKFSRLGGTRLLHSDFRLISATNQDPKEKIRDGSFREDLYYRIAVVPLTIPPLRERPDDVKHLAAMFHAYFASAYKVAAPPLSAAELDSLCARPWPGNVRELRSFIERGIILYDPLKQGFLQEALSMQDSEADSKTVPATGADKPVFACDDLPSMEELQKRYMAHVLRLTKGKVKGDSGAQEILQMKVSSLYKKMKKYGLDKTTLIYGDK